MEKENLIPIDKIKEDFYYFIKNIENNKRIFFSGRFGIGKTYFLKEFFLSRMEEYESFYFSPANYQINKNEDIIDLIKYDILVELIGKNNNIFNSKEEKGLSDSAKLFISFFRERGSVNGSLQTIIDNATNLIGLYPDPLMQSLSKLGRPLKDLLELDKEFQLFKNDYLKGEKGIVEKYIDEICEKKINESDYIGHLIKEKIIQQKGDKKSVLILDDIDRVDPDHIFRILNVLSAHFDDEKNKFNFDHIVIVGDIKNIQSVFYHKYGGMTDFWGYFDKFFTVRPYYLENKEIVVKFIPELMKDIRCDEPRLESAIGESGYIKLLLSDILTRSLNVGKLNLRQLYKPLRYNFPELKKGVYLENAFQDDSQKIMDIGIRILVAIFGDLEFFISVLKEVRKDIKEEDDGRSAPYNFYSALIIKKISFSPNFVTGKDRVYREYEYTFMGEQHREIIVKGMDSVKTKFFYDALIDYVGQLKHVKNNNWEYDT